MSSIVVLGSVNMDYVVRVTRLPTPGETVPGGDLVTTFGGKGANAAVAAARLGGQVGLIGSVGRDSAGAQYLDHLAGEHVDTSAVLQSADRPTGCALILVDAQAENMIAVAPGANHAVSITDIQEQAGMIESAAILLCQFEMPLDCVRAAIHIANTARVPVVLNPSPIRADFDWSGLHIDYLVVNDGEAELLAGAKDASASTLRIRSDYENVVITRGARPTDYASHHDSGQVPAFEVRCVDTVGAGDTFVGALAVAIAEDMPLPSAIRFANAAAALATTRMGAQASMPARPEVEELLSGQAE